MATIPLSKGKVALVDDEDYEWLMQWKWCLVGTYAGRFVGPGKNRKYISMARLIMNTPDHLDVDHINWDRLDNRRANLRNVTRSENIKNRPPWAKSGGAKPGAPRRKRPHSSGKLGTSQVRGVWFKKGRKKPWVASIRMNGKLKCLGYFATKEEAGQAYRHAKEAYLMV